jgi:hypothetical protein
MVFAKLPNALVHIHGALFVSWIFLLVIQNVLVAARRVKWHMTLGILGVILAPLVVVFGVLTVFDSIRRNRTGIPAELILVSDGARNPQRRDSYRTPSLDAAALVIAGEAFGKDINPAYDDNEHAATRPVKNATTRI